MTIEVKICGIKTEAALDAALEAGADYVGLVLHSPSPRDVNFELAETLADRARGRAQVVALAVEPGPALLAVIASDVRPHILQLHGQESPDDVAYARNWMKECGGRAGAACKIWKAISIRQASDLADASLYAGLVDRILFDAKPPPGAGALPGGNGLTFDWRILDGCKDKSFVLAGGLTPENVAEAIRFVEPAVVDVSSGVETSPGEKSPELIRRFLQAAKGIKGSAGVRS